jgi:NAD(P)-dependent dehydrogenase (short-subunit alcohol dehydrogenase family)
VAEDSRFSLAGEVVASPAAQGCSLRGVRRQQRRVGRRRGLRGRDRLGSVSGLVNCAAIDAVPGQPGNDLPFESYPSDQFDAILDVNLQGVVRCCQAFGADMAEGRARLDRQRRFDLWPRRPRSAALRAAAVAAEAFYKPAVYSCRRPGSSG